MEIDFGEGSVGVDMGQGRWGQMRDEIKKKENNKEKGRQTTEAE